MMKPNGMDRDSFTMKLRDWMVEHPRIMAAIFLLLAAPNFWAAYRMLVPHPVMAVANGAAGTALVVFAIFLWPRRGTA